jgi:hypothetical protein
MLSLSESVSGLESSKNVETISGRDLQIEWLLGVEGVDRSKEVSIVVAIESNESISSIVTAPIVFEVAIVLMKEYDCDGERRCRKKNEEM